MSIPLPQLWAFLGSLLVVARESPMLLLKKFTSSNVPGLHSLSSFVSLRRGARGVLVISLLRSFRDVCVCLWSVVVTVS